MPFPREFEPVSDDLRRLRVPGGWLVLASFGRGSALTFLPDPDWSWELRPVEFDEEFSGEDPKWQWFRCKCTVPQTDAAEAAEAIRALIGSIQSHHPEGFRCAHLREMWFHSHFSRRFPHVTARHLSKVIWSMVTQLDPDRPPELGKSGEGETSTFWFAGPNDRVWRPGSRGKRGRWEVSRNLVLREVGR